MCDLVVRRRGRACDSARSATHGCANRCTGRASDRKRYETPDSRTETGTRRTTFHRASAGIRVPSSVGYIISAVIVRIGEPANMLIMLMSGVPIGVVIPDWHIFTIGVQPMHSPARAVLITRDIGFFDRFGAGDCGRHQSCACNSEKRTQSKRSVKLSHASPFIWVSRIRHPFRDVMNAAGGRSFRPSICRTHCNPPQGAVRSD